MTIVDTVQDMPFENISGDCLITDLVSREFKQSAGANGVSKCEIRAVYRFCTPQSCDHLSWDSPVEFSYCGAYEEHEYLPFAVNQTTSCWKPKQGAKINKEIWPCGNPECYRIYEPGATGSKEHMAFLFPLLMMYGISICLCCTGWYTCPSLCPSFRAEAEMSEGSEEVEAA
eukprot:CAMPEP_0197628576 /NCGR_PEP_ID=MMETSP1338-20131121/6826_1 /TAXON_ID=43686 ORGANISM="Pelagodinium beii, Strain RCC1491" /NCGR_SAMPLE_ID=MMETSP1338 /ASSEMBLY_ACC=CAM_ASM_000754 /LENGTH=171 /DNA_ID=CAMNT_0043199559 /DNA_START=183 /DNA_END=701 /DNA_ORIENTATION=+